MFMTSKSLIRAIAPVAVLGLGLLPGTSRADISFTMNPVSTDTQTGAFNQVDATTFQALNLNQNPVLGQDTPILQIVTDTAGTVQGSGQSMIVAVAPPGFGDVVITPINPPLVGFTTLEVNPFTAPGTAAPGNFTLIATDGKGATFTSPTFSFDANGQNRFAAVASNGEIITRLEMVVQPASADILKQFRLNFVLAGGIPNPVPEPSTVALALSGLGTIGLMALRRRRSGRGEATA